uniref:tRNA/rRNA methyltransferase SpoU type domain-containing protein n=1 Tax=Musca domestica TaxID=7370 RepID=A0A1I8MW94_MUSDO
MSGAEKGNHNYEKSLHIVEEKQNNIDNFIKFQMHQVNNADLNVNALQQAVTTVSIDDLFEILEKNFESYRNISNLKNLLPFIHFSLRRYVHKDHSNFDIGLCLYAFYKTHKETEQDLMIVVQIIHQFLYSLNVYDSNETNVAAKVFVDLAKQLPTTVDRKLVANIIACLHLYRKMHKDNSGLIQIILTDLLECLKTISVHRKTHVDILMQLFDDFCAINSDLYCEPVVIATIQTLLKSSQREERKSAYYLLKKMILFFIKSQKEKGILLSSDYWQNIERHWLIYATILENLEENQSHLILPSLDNLKDVINGKLLQSSWMDILFVRILSHTNSLVIRWSIEYFLTTFTCSELNSHVLRQFLEVCNSNMLYNCEGYFLKREKFSKFLQGDLTNVYELIGEINWKAVPLHNLLTVLKSYNNESVRGVTYDQVIKIAARIRALQDYHIRQSALAIANEIFDGIIEKMNMREYVNYVEALCNPTDKCNVFEKLYSKVGTVRSNETARLFDGRFYEILLTNSPYYMDKEFITFLKKLPIAMHGWLKYLPFHLYLGNDGTLKEFTDLYNIKIEDYIELKLPCYTADRNEYDRHLLAAISFYVRNLKSLDNVSEDTFRIIFNHKLTWNIIERLSNLLMETQRNLSTWVITNLVDQILPLEGEFAIPLGIGLLRYLERKGCLKEYLTCLIEKRPSLIFYSQTCVLGNPIFESWNYGCDDIKKGDSRIEESYRATFLGRPNNTMRNLWLYQINTFGGEDYILHLVNQHKLISKKKPRYFANSYEHRLKIRIALGLANANKDISFISDDLMDSLWSILLDENNQLNISYFYEYIVGTLGPSKDEFLKKLKAAHSLTSSQQVSILSALFTFCMRNADQLNHEDKNTVITDLMALTMGANFHTRLFAQLVLFNLLATKEFHEIPYRSQLMKSIEVATQGKLEEHCNDLRLYLYTFDDAFDAWNLIMYVTNAPYDEIVRNFNDSLEIEERISKCKIAFSKKVDRNVENNSENNIVCNQVQRKMNPSKEVLESSNLMVYPAKQTDCQMFVIASLIDKLPNLGGIARTCEVLGIENLVMDTKKDVEKNDFKNLSMTAEKSLNIMEVKANDLRDFIIEKQREGYAVVGAEQTCNSENFVNFKFPEKCILLLGHEKDGIPPTLLGLLDHAVEIPQFGQVRSLNVHVTGALFMWEYCKQHLVKSL